MTADHARPRPMLPRDDLYARLELPVDAAPRRSRSPGGRSSSATIPTSPGPTPRTSRSGSTSPTTGCRIRTCARATTASAIRAGRAAGGGRPTAPVRGRPAASVAGPADRAPTPARRPGRGARPPPRPDRQADAGRARPADPRRDRRRSRSSPRSPGSSRRTGWPRSRPSSGGSTSGCRARVALGRRRRATRSSRYAQEIVLGSVPRRAPLGPFRERVRERLTPRLGGRRRPAALRPEHRRRVARPSSGSGRCRRPSVPGSSSARGPRGVRGRPADLPWPRRPVARRTTTRCGSRRRSPSATPRRSSATRRRRWPAGRWPGDARPRPPPRVQAGRARAARSGRGATCWSRLERPVRDAAERPARGVSRARSERAVRGRTRCVGYDSGSRVRWALRSAPRSQTADPDPTCRPDRAPPTSREGPVRSHCFPCPSIPSGSTPELLRAVADQGYTEPTPVQREAIPLVLAGRDLLAGAQTGTGKTAAFVLPILQRLNGDPDARLAVAPPARRDRRATAATPRDPPIRALVLTPTRELALQVEESVRTYGAHRRDPIGRDLRRRRLRAAGPRPPRRPGDRRRDARPPPRPRRPAARSTCRRSRSSSSTRPTGCSTWASSATSAGSSTCCPRERQNLLFSATFSDDIRRARGRDSCATRRPSRSRRATRATALVTQVVLPVDRERKRELLSHLIRSGRIEQALVFTRTKHGANRLAEQLARDGIAATAIHGNKSQGQRVRALDDFKAGRADDPRRHRGRLARPRHRGAAARRQLRAADGRRGLRPPDRPDRSGRLDRRRDLARLRRRGAAPPRDRARCSATDPDRGDPGLRARPLDPRRSRSASARRAARVARWALAAADQMSAGRPTVGAGRPNLGRGPDRSGTRSPAAGRSSPRAGRRAPRRRAISSGPGRAASRSGAGRHRQCAGRLPRASTSPGTTAGSTTTGPTRAGPTASRSTRLEPARHSGSRARPAPPRTPDLHAGRADVPPPRGLIGQPIGPAPAGILPPERPRWPAHEGSCGRPDPARRG